MLVFFKSIGICWLVCLLTVAILLVCGLRDAISIQSCNAINFNEALNEFESSFPCPSPQMPFLHTLQSNLQESYNNARDIHEVLLALISSSYDLYVLLLREVLLSL